MALDIDKVLVSFAVDSAKKYYDKKTLEHATRVAKYVVDNHAIQTEYLAECYSLAMMHDLLEDTQFDIESLPYYTDNFKKALQLLTKPKNMSYDDYCARFKNYLCSPYGRCAWFVKLADMKDHLSQVDTLTPRLKEKYLNGLRYLL